MSISVESRTADLSSPLRLERGPQWANRWALAPLTNKQSHADGSLSDDEYDWLVARAHGGFGVVNTCAASVSPDGKIWTGQLGIHDDRHDSGLRRLADGLRAADSVSAVQLHHGGLRAVPEVSGHPAAAPWADGKRGVEAMSTADVRRVIDDFVSSAQRAERAGFDGVQVHGAHGYLLCQFLNPERNLREDGYGGSFEDRSRALFEVLQGIRESTGPGFQVGVRVSPEGYGTRLEENLELMAQLFSSDFVDHVDISMWDVRKSPRDGGVEGSLMSHVMAVPRHGVPVGVAGKILSTADAAWCLEQGADFVSIGTAAIIHHDLPRLASESEFVSETQPFPRQRLVDEFVGAAFIDYLAGDWDDFVA